MLGAAIRLGLSNIAARLRRPDAADADPADVHVVVFHQRDGSREDYAAADFFARCRRRAFVPQRGWSPLPPQAIGLRAELAWPESEATQGSGVVAARWWYASQIPEEPWLIPVRLSRRSDTSDTSGSGEAAAASCYDRFH